MKVLIFLAAFLFLAGCAGTKSGSDIRYTGNTYYFTAAPPAGNSDELSHIVRSIRKIYSVSTYRTFQFNRETAITGYHIQSGQYRNRAPGIISTSETVFGTAMVISNENSSLTLLTCAHVVMAPDTIVSYFEPTGSDASRYIQSISIKEKQENWVRDVAPCGPFRVMAADQDLDIAILGRNCEFHTDTVHPFTFPTGRSPEVGWGTQLYLAGYPLGYLMLTTGIASPLPKRPHGEFTTDALLNKGFSGGPVLALRNLSGQFELVGIVKEVSSERLFYLSPTNDQQRVPEWLPYTGTSHVSRNDQLQYGLNEIIPIGAVRNFYLKNRDELRKSGHSADRFFGLMND